MAEAVISVNLNATFERMKIGDEVAIPLNYVTSENVRAAAHRFSRKSKDVRIKVSAPQGSTQAIVICEPKCE